ncbi:MAG: 50S ribosomal protein L3 [Verrucomicrobia bacterium]|jgi:large subunit ribosomal protein L3|nr:50S ribosomal protein L3 [Verrucomicrobiota bacterium]
MSTALIGKKLGMTQVYAEDGTLVPVTVIEAGPCPVLQVKTMDTDGYNAVQIGFGTRKAKNVPSALKGHLQKAGVEGVSRVREVRLPEAPKTETGSALTVAEVFQDEAKVDVIGMSKGRGFQGVVKRWNFSGGPASHGSMFHRRGGSYGMCQWPGKILKGKKMPGRFGGDQRTVQNLKIVRVIPEKNLLLVKGSVPGPNGGNVLVRTAIKKRATA